jgi:hypothetical protein
MTYYQTDSFSNTGVPVFSLRCPECGKEGSLDGVSNQDVALLPANVAVGSRRCPNPKCHAHIFIVYSGSNELLVSYPPEVIDFDATNIPSAVVEAMGEAIICHSQECYIAAAIMVRKTLEELCADRGAEGANLKERITALGEKVVLPKDLLEGLDDLRLLGNDAAHIESREFNNVGQEEVEVGIEFAKEVLKATYQYSDLLTRLRALKATQADQ